MFISYSGADRESASLVAGILHEAGVETRLDREDISFGDSFVTFMNSALEMSSYCLLLWSEAAASSPWVKAEWESAFVRSIRQKRSFLVVGRLEDILLPALLEPRLRVDLFPDLEAGVHQVVDAWRTDRSVAKASKKPVGSTRLPLPNSDGINVYVASELFKLTVPVALSTDVPIGASIDQIVSSLGLPKTWHHEGRVGMSFNYVLMFGERTLRPSATLADEGVPEKALLNLLVQMTTFAAEEPSEGVLRRVTFRGATKAIARDPEIEGAAISAREALHTALIAAGLVFDDAR